MSFPYLGWPTQTPPETPETSAPQSPNTSPLLQGEGCMRAKSFQLCLTLCDPMDYSPPGSSVHGDSPGKNTGVVCRAFLQGIFLTQRSNPCLLHWQAGSLPQHHLGSPRRRDWIQFLSKLSGLPSSQLPARKSSTG